MKNENFSFGLVSAVVIAGVILALFGPIGSTQPSSIPVTPAAAIEASE